MVKTVEVNITIEDPDEDEKMYEGKYILRKWNSGMKTQVQDRASVSDARGITKLVLGTLQFETVYECLTVAPFDISNNKSKRKNLLEMPSEVLDALFIQVNDLNMGTSLSEDERKNL